MIYKIVEGKESYLLPLFEYSEDQGDEDEYYDKEDYLINPRPCSFSGEWGNLIISFTKDPALKNRELSVPDICRVGMGKLFLSEIALKAMKSSDDSVCDYLENKELCELLPVTFSGGKGFIFNPLVEVESSDIKDVHGNLSHVIIDEDKLDPKVLAFKTMTDHYVDIHCTDGLLKAVKNVKALGVQFANSLGRYGEE